MQTKAQIVYIVELESSAKQSFQLVIKFKNKSNQGIYTDKPSTQSSCETHTNPRHKHVEELRKEIEPNERNTIDGERTKRKRKQKSGSRDTDVQMSNFSNVNRLMSMKAQNSSSVFTFEQIIRYSQFGSKAFRNSMSICAVELRFDYANFRHKFNTINLN